MMKTVSDLFKDDVEVHFLGDADRVTVWTVNGGEREEFLFDAKGARRLGKALKKAARLAEAAE